MRLAGGNGRLGLAVLASSALLAAIIWHPRAPGCNDLAVLSLEAIPLHRLGKPAERPRSPVPVLLHPFPAEAV